MYLGNLHPNITEEDLMELLRPFGTVTKLVMARNEDVRASVCHVLNMFMNGRTDGWMDGWMSFKFVMARNEDVRMDRYLCA